MLSTRSSGSCFSQVERHQANHRFSGVFNCLFAGKGNGNKELTGVWLAQLWIRLRLSGLLLVAPNQSGSWQLQTVSEFPGAVFSASPWVACRNESGHDSVFLHDGYSISPWVNLCGCVSSKRRPSHSQALALQSFQWLMGAEQRVSLSSPWWLHHHVQGLNSICFVEDAYQPQGVTSAPSSVAKFG